MAFGVALKEAAEAAGVGSSVLLAAHLTDHGHQVTQPTVASWMRGAIEPERPTVLVIEELLGLKAGELSCRLGWLPIEAAVPSVELGILADPDITPAQADAVIAMLRAFREQ